jgi:hypothetical protein
VASFTVPEGDPALIAELGGFAVITEGSNRAALEAALSMKRSIAAETPSLEAWRTETQVYAIATPAGVRFAQQQILTGLAVAKQQVQQAGPQAEQAVFGIEIYENLFKNLDREVTYAAVGLRIEDSGDVRIIGRTRLAEGGVLASMTAGAKPGSADVLAGLPKMPFVFAGGGVMSPEATEPLMKASIGMMKLYPGGKDMTEEQTEKLVKVSAASMRGMRSMGMMMGVGQGDEPLYSSMFIVIKADDAQAYLQNYLDTVREMDEIFSSSEFPFSYEVEEMQFAGRRGLKLSMDMSGMFGQQEVPEAEKMMELMFGEGDTMDVYMAVADEQTVLGAYVSQPNLTDVLESYVQGQNQLSEMPQVASTVSKLDSDAQTIGLWSPQGTLAMISRLASAIDPAAAAQIPELGATPPIGFTISSSPGVLDTEAIIPAEMLKTVAAMVQQLMPQVPPPEEQF